MEPSLFAGAVVVLLFSVILHEVMHGLAALYFGDHTAEQAGRLTLNPLPHIDPIGTLLVPALFLLPALLAPGTSPGYIIGWAKPVPVNPFNFRDIRKGELATSAAGVLANLSLAIIAAILFHLTTPLFNLALSNILLFAVRINILLAAFNLLPIPPLDGSKIVLSFLPPQTAANFQRLERYSIFILLFLLFFPAGQLILQTYLGFFFEIFRKILGV